MTAGIFIYRPTPALTCVSPRLNAYTARCGVAAGQVGRFTEASAEALELKWLPAAAEWPALGPEVVPPCRRVRVAAPRQRLPHRILAGRFLAGQALTPRWFFPLAVIRGSSAPR